MWRAVKISPKWLMFFVFCYVGFQLLGNIAEATWFGASHLTVMNLITGAYVSTDATGGIVSVLSVASDWGTAIFGLLTWDYSFLTGELVLLRWIFSAFTVGFIWGAVQLARGTAA